MVPVILVALLFLAPLKAATYYIRTAGNDSCNGTAATLGSSGACAWATIGHALTAGSLTTGDQVWVGGGIYRQAAIVLAYSGWTMTADVDGSQTGDAGAVTWTGYTTNDSSAPITGILIDTGNRHDFTVDGFNVISGTNYLMTLGNATEAINNVIFRRCILSGPFTSSISLVWGLFDTASHAITFDRCVFLNNASGAPGVEILVAQNNSADFNVGIVIENSIFFGGGAWLLDVGKSGSGSHNGGGVTFINNTVLGGSGQKNPITTTTISTTFPLTIKNSYFDLHMRGNAPLDASNSGEIIEDYNAFDAMVTSNINVSAGAHSLNAPNLSVMVNFGTSYLWPLIGRCTPLFSPLAGSPLLGAGTATGAPSIDATGKSRPNPPSIGAFEAGSYCNVISGVF